MPTKKIVKNAKNAWQIYRGGGGKIELSVRQIRGLNCFVAKEIAIFLSAKKYYYLQAFKSLTDR